LFWFTFHIISRPVCCLWCWFTNSCYGYPPCIQIACPWVTRFMYIVSFFAVSGTKSATKFGDQFHSKIFCDLGLMIGCDFIILSYCTFPRSDSVGSIRIGFCIPSAKTVHLKFITFIISLFSSERAFTTSHHQAPHPPSSPHSTCPPSQPYHS
jgi:hypothetical protein